MFTVDASVWVNGFDQREGGHDISRRFLDYLEYQAIPVIMPSLVIVEVAGAISRTRKNSVQAQAFANALSRLSNITLLPLDKVLSFQALELAAKYELRGADAVYAAVALQSGSTLVSWDNEHLTRLSSLVSTQTPSMVLANRGSAL